MNPIAPRGRAMRDAMLETIYQAMRRDPGIFFVTADFGSPALDQIRADRPDRFVNVGIAEQNLVNISAGLALEGFKVFAYAIAPFITMRCLEQIRISLVLLSNTRSMNVNLIGVGAGCSYVLSGPTHQCYEDISVMRSLPNMRIFSPSDHFSASAMAERSLEVDGPKYLRLDAQVLPPLYGEGGTGFDNGFAVHLEGDEICLVATGFMTHTALNAAKRLAEQGLNVGVIDLFDITGFDAGELNAVLSGYRGLVTLEEGFSGRGGIDAVIFDHLAINGLPHRVLNIGVRNGYLFEINERRLLHERLGIGEQAVVDKIGSFARCLPG